MTRTPAWLPRCAARLQSGFATVEYCVVCAVIVAALFVGPQSIPQMLTDAVKAFYRALTFFVSLP